MSVWRSTATWAYRAPTSKFKNDQLLEWVCSIPTMVFNTIVFISFFHGVWLYGIMALWQYTYCMCKCMFALVNICVNSFNERCQRLFHFFFHFKIFVTTTQSNSGDLTHITIDYYYLVKLTEIATNYCTAYMPNTRQVFNHVFKLPLNKFYIAEGNFRHFVWLTL